jgi:hypothetical protein
MQGERGAHVILLINIHHKAETLDLTFQRLAREGLNEGPGLPRSQQILGWFSSEHKRMGRASVGADGLPLPKARLQPAGVLTMLQPSEGLPPPIH